MADVPTRGTASGQYLQNINVRFGADPFIHGEREPSSWFGPLKPPPPSAPPDVAGRQWDLPPGYNLQTRPRAYEPITFKQLRAMADGLDILRLVIETRKDQIARMKWNIRPCYDKKSNGYETKIAAIMGFFRNPDRRHSWADWLRIVLEDMFVIDAASFYIQRTRGGYLNALIPIDGATIKPVIDDWGHTPLPFIANGKSVYPVAYQQVLRGLPAVDYSVRDMIYRPRNIRATTPYGFSPVEQIATTINIALRRQLFLLNYYTDGSIPDSLCGVPDTWTPDQISAFQHYMDDIYSGNLANRRRMKFVPAAISKSFIQTKEPELSGTFDEWLARIICFAFSISPQPFVKMQNRATAEVEKQASEEEGIEPSLKWVKALIDFVIETEFGTQDLEFQWEEHQVVDEIKQENILSGYTSRGIMTVNEAREALGMDPRNDPAANEAMVLTAAGYVPLNARIIEGQKETMSSCTSNSSKATTSTNAAKVYESLLA